MNDVFTEMATILQNEVIERHTFFQLKHFVLGAEPTHQGKLQCCLRELRSRKQQLQNMQRELDDLRDQNTLLQVQLDRIQSESPTDQHGIDLLDEEEIEKFDKEKEIEVRGVDRRIRAAADNFNEIQRKIKYVTEECQFFVSAFKQLNEVEPLKPFDDLEVQKEYWNAKLEREFRTRLILGQPLDSELVKAIESLHDDANVKKEVIQLIQSQQRLIGERAASATIALD